jgi:hypothetical protein
MKTRECENRRAAAPINFLKTVITSLSTRTRSKLLKIKRLEIELPLGAHHLCDLRARRGNELRSESALVPHTPLRKRAALGRAHHYCDGPRRPF